MFKIVGLVFVIGYSSLINALEIPKNDWVNAMKTALPAIFCNSEQYFRECFSVTAIECEETVTSATRICIAELENQIPDILVQPKDGKFWGERVGECTGNTYEITLIKKRISSAKCSDITNW